MINYRKYNLGENVEKFLEHLRFNSFTPIQTKVIPQALRGKSVIAKAATGTGKTHAFLIPIFEKIDTSLNKTQAVVIAPTRELASQIFNFANEYRIVDESINIKLISGGKDKDRMLQNLNQQPHLVIGTPGRLKDLFIDEEALRLDLAKVLVLDEIDMIADMGFLNDVDNIAGKMPKDLQIMTFSATISQEIEQFLNKYMEQPLRIDLTTDDHHKADIEHVLIPVKHQKYKEELVNILKGFDPFTCLIFANTKDEVKETAEYLRDNGYTVLELHGDLPSRARKQAMRSLVNNEFKYVVASDMVARGIDLEGVSHIVSLGFPSELEFYIHRAGRTGRNNQSGVCFALYKEKEIPVIKQLEKRDIKFNHRQFKNGVWSELKAIDAPKPKAKKKQDPEVGAIIKKGSKKVKPGYKKRINQEIDQLKRKRRRELIKSEIAKQKKERAKNKERMKNDKNR